MLNWSLAVPLTLWLIPGLLLMRSLNPRILIHEMTNSNKSAIQRLLILSINFLFILWLVFTVYLIAPFSGHLQVSIL